MDSKQNYRREVTPGGTVIERWEETLDCGCVAKFWLKDRPGMVESGHSPKKRCDKHRKEWQG